jgi:hypothetical protein
MDARMLNRVERVLTAAADRHLDARLGQCQRDRAAYPTAAAGDQGVAARDRHGISPRSARR